MIALGVVSLFAAKADFRGKDLATFNAAKVAWAAEGGGAKQFSNAFALNPTSLTFTMGTTLAPTSFVLPLALSSQATALADPGGDVKRCAPRAAGAKAAR